MEPKTISQLARNYQSNSSNKRFCVYCLEEKEEQSFNLHEKICKIEKEKALFKSRDKPIPNDREDRLAYSYLNPDMLDQNFDLEEVSCSKCGDKVVKQFMSDHICQIKECPICNQHFKDDKELSDHIDAHEFELNEEQNSNSRSQNPHSNNNANLQQEERKTSYLQRLQAANRGINNQFENQLQASEDRGRRSIQPNIGGLTVEEVINHFRQMNFMNENRNNNRNVDLQNLQEYNGGDSSDEEEDDTHFISRQIRDHDRPRNAAAVVNIGSNFMIIRRQQPGQQQNQMNEEQLMNYLMNDHLRSSEKPLGSDVEEALPETTFYKKNLKVKSDDDKSKCTICQLDYEDGDTVVTTPCIHYYHKRCISEWFKRQNFCPICRTPIRLN